MPAERVGDALFPQVAGLPGDLLGVPASTTSSLRSLSTPLTAAHSSACDAPLRVSTTLSPETVTVRLSCSPTKVTTSPATAPTASAPIVTHGSGSAGTTRTGAGSGRPGNVTSQLVTSRSSQAVPTTAPAPTSTNAAPTSAAAQSGRRTTVAGPAVLSRLSTYAYSRRCPVIGPPVGARR
ncbi:MAG: hypothetical protein V7646_2846 [Pseudonocardia sp.]